MARSAAMAGILLLTTVSQAATFTVNTTADTVDILPGDGFARDASGNTSLRAAIMEANADGGADDILVPAGTYKLSGANDDDLGLSGDLDILSNMTITGAGAAATIIDANSVDRVFDVGNGAVALSGLTIQKGLIQGSGAGIRIGPGTVVSMMNCEVFDNDTADNNDAAGGARGGGIFIAAAPLIDGGTAGSLVLSGSTISANACNDVGAGGTTQGAGIFSAGNLTVRNSTISGNSCTGVNVPGSRGGGLMVAGGTVTIENCTIAGNSARGDGANLSRTAGTVNVRNTIISGGLGGPDNCGGMITSLGFNISDDDSCGFDQTGDLADTDPQLGELADNGGPTRTHLPTSESPAIDGGDDANCQGTDQRGLLRPQQNGCDVGAVEVAPTDGVGGGDDTDDDGIRDDFDGDGQPDDADDDGTADALEDENDDGIPDGLQDTDGDGTPDAFDPDQQDGDNDNGDNDNGDGDDGDNDNDDGDNDNGDDDGDNDNTGDDDDDNGDEDGDDNDGGADGLDDIGADCGECGNGTGTMLLMTSPFMLVGLTRRRR